MEYYACGAFILKLNMLIGDEKMTWLPFEKKKKKKKKNPKVFS